MKIFVAIITVLLLQSVVTAFEALAGFGLLRIEPAIPVLVLAALAGPSLAAALLAGSLGLISDLMSLSPLGLHVLIFSIVFFVARALIDGLGLRNLSAVFLFVFLLSVLARFLLEASLLLFSDQAQAFSDPLVQVVAAFIDALLTIPLWVLWQNFLVNKDDADISSAHWSRR